MKLHCSSCRTTILAETHERNEGLCAPCARDRLNPFFGQPKFGCIAHYIDASALIKFFVEEDGSGRIRNHVSKCFAARRSFELVFRTTYLCFGETLGYFKTKRRRKELSQAQYSDIAKRVLQSISHTFEIEEPFLHILPNVQSSVAQMIDRYGLDISDAFQLVAIRWIKEQNVRLIGGMEAILVTADSEFVCAARAEGIRAWNIVSDAAP